MKYPNIHVDLTDTDGDPYLVLGRVTVAMTQAGCTSEQVKEFLDDVTSLDYYKVLQTCMKYVNAND